MNEAAGFISAIADDVYDDTPRLVFADWLEDHGDSARAEFIRIQCELEPMRDRYEIDRAAELHAREDKLLREHQETWLRAMPVGWDNWQLGISVEFRRGFVDTLSLPVRTVLNLGQAIRQLHPTIRRLVLFRANGYGERLAASPLLQDLPELELACWYSDEDAQAIAASPHLSKLQVLELWLARGDGGLTDERLCQIMAASKAWPGLREMTLLNPDPEEERGGQPLADEANRIAGRKVAVYRRAYPEVYPFAADFWYTFPGYLPDGRMAMADEDQTTSPPTLCVLTFDKDGFQTDEVLRVALPDDVLAIPVKEWYQHRNRMQQHLIDTIGFKPGFIRVRDSRFPGDEHDYNRPEWDYYEDLGGLDADDESSWRAHPGGYGGWATYRVRGQQWVFGWDRYADKLGRVHST